MPEISRFYEIAIRKPNNSVRSVRWIRDYVLRVVFSDGYVGLVDFAGLFEHNAGPLVEALRDPKQFKQVSVQNNTVTFANGYDICPDVLRFYCEKGRHVSRRETDAAFERFLLPVASRQAALVVDHQAQYVTKPSKEQTRSTALALAEDRPEYRTKRGKRE
jgi:hypothetical protein